MKTELNVLVGCEHSGTVRDAFRKLGHNAISADLLETSAPGPHHKGDVRDLFSREFDLFICFPPCTYLSWASKAYWDRPGRARKRLEALDFFLQMWEAPFNYIALENPLGIASQVITKHHQTIEPYYFGDPEQKRTNLWLKNLPPLIHFEQPNLFGDATHVKKPEPIYVQKSGPKAGQKIYATVAKSGNNEGGHYRSIFWPGIAEAMAVQWSEFILSKQSTL